MPRTTRGQDSSGEFVAATRETDGKSSRSGLNSAASTELEPGRNTDHIGSTVLLAQ